MRLRASNYTRISMAGLLLVAVLLALALTGCGGGDDGEQASISVKESDITSIADTTKAEGEPALVNEFTVPANSTLSIDADTLATVKTKTDLPHPLATVGVVDVTNGDYREVLAQAVSHDDGYDITDARATDSMLLWVETKETTQEWRLYRASLSGASVDQPIELASGDKKRQTPAIAAIGVTAIWVDALQTDLREGGETSYVYASDGGPEDKRVLFKSTNPLVCDPRRSEDILTVVDWGPIGGSRRSVLHAIKIGSGEEIATLRLPSPIRVSDASYMAGGFSFSVPALYEASGPLGNVGTYIQTGEKTFVRFPKTPLDTPQYTNGAYVVKNGKPIYSYKAAEGSYQVIAAPIYAPDYGEYLAAEGVSSHLVLFTQNLDGNGQSTGTAVRVLAP